MKIYLEIVLTVVCSILPSQWDTRFRITSMFHDKYELSLYICHRIFISQEWHIRSNIFKAYYTSSLTLRRPFRRKVRMRRFFDISKVKESSFFLNRTLMTLHQIFDAHLLKKPDLSPSRFHFSVGFRSRSWFESDGFIAYPNECLFTLTNL